MVGNDIVDLRDGDALPGALHPRFDARVFATSERDLIAAGGNTVRWMLWAAKESAYKVARRLDPSCVFAPSRFVVTLASDLRGSVRYGALDLPVAFEVGDDHVHAVATAPGGAPGRVDAAVGRLPRVSPEDEAHGAPGRAARKLAVACAARSLALEPAFLSIAREGRAPRVTRKDGEPVGTLSLSHHGRFVACAFDPSATPGPM